MNTAGWAGTSRARDGGRKTIRMSVSPCARWWWVDPAGVQATRLAGTIDVPRSVCTDRTPRAAYTRCPRGVGLRRAGPPRRPEMHPAGRPDVRSGGWRPTGMTWHSTGGGRVGSATTVPRHGRTMRAAVCVRAGGPEVLEIREVPVPAVREGWSLVRVRGAGLNRSELRTRQGHSPSVTVPAGAGDRMRGRRGGLDRSLVAGGNDRRGGDGRDGPGVRRRLRGVRVAAERAADAGHAPRCPGTCWPRCRRRT